MHQTTKNLQKNSLIVWEKWVDPLGNEEENTFINESYNQDDEQTIIKTKPFKMLMTPMGMIPYNENTAASSIFNFWVGHTNFDISSEICSLIEEADGVETLDIFTRYRFRIGIGKVFDDGEIMRQINNLINRYFNYDKSANQ
jgi:hypothetical protein